MAAIAGCNSDSSTPSKVAYRFDHIDRFVKTYSDIIVQIPLSSPELEEVILDMQSRVEQLYSSGDTAAAQYFVTAVDDYIRSINPALADSLGLRL